VGLELGVTCAALLGQAHPNPSSVVAARRDVTRALGAISELGSGAPTGVGAGKSAGNGRLGQSCGFVGPFGNAVM
jgi:hypothetical protein